MDNEGGVFMVDCEAEYSKPKMPLRDWFAGMALQGYIAARAEMGEQQLVNLCYAKADAMLEERKK